MRLLAEVNTILRGINAGAKHADTADVAGFLQTPTQPAPDAGPLVESDHISAVVSRCINVIADDAAHVPLQLLDVGGERPTEVMDHDAIELWRHINTIETPTVYLQQLYADLLVEGNHFAWVGMIDNVPKVIIRIPPEQVEVIPHRRRLIGGYLWTAPDGTDELYRPEQVIHVRTRNPQSIYRGMGFLPRLREQIIFDRDLRNFKLNQIQMGIPTSLIVTVNRGFANDAEWERFRDEFWQRTRGVKNAGKPMFVRAEDIKVDALPRPTESEVQILQNLKYTRNEIAMLFGVPPSRLSDYSESFRASASEQSRTYWQDTIQSWHRLFVDYLNSCYLPKWFPNERRKLKFAFDYRQVRALALSTRDMAQLNQILINSGMRTPNEGAISVGDAAHENPAADELYMNGKKLGAEQPPALKPPQGGTQPGEVDPDNDDEDGNRPDENQDEEGRAHLRLVVKGVDVNLENMWLANAQFTRAETAGDARRVFGVASTATVDRQNTVVDQGSLGAAAQAYFKRNGKIFYNHNWAVPIGRTIGIEAEEKQLLVGAEIGSGWSVPIESGFGAVRMPVDDIWAMIQQRALSSYSVAFNADEIRDVDDEDENGEEKPVKLIVTDLFEISIVSIPANPDAEFSITKAAHNPVFVKMLRNADKLEHSISAFSAPAVAAAMGGGGDGSIRFGLDESEAVDWSQVKERVEQWRQRLATKS